MIRRLIILLLIVGFIFMKPFNTEKEFTLDYCKEFCGYDNGKIPYRITIKDEKLFVMAGIWELWASGNNPYYSFSILTKQANEQISNIHHRMPAILTNKQRNTWLNEIDTYKAISMIKESSNIEMKYYEVFKNKYWQVNNWHYKLQKEAVETKKVKFKGVTIDRYILDNDELIKNPINTIKKINIFFNLKDNDFFNKKITKLIKKKKKNYFCNIDDNLKKKSLKIYKTILNKNYEK